MSISQWERACDSVSDVRMLRRVVTLAHSLTHTDRQSITVADGQLVT